MDALDFSALTDDQIVELVRLALQEVVRRGPIAEAAARAACLDEQERATIAAQAAAAERDKLLAEERRRVADEAAAAVRREAERTAKAAPSKTAQLEQEVRDKAKGIFGGRVEIAVKTESGRRRVFLGSYPAAATYFRDGDRFNEADSLKISSKDERIVKACESRGITFEQLHAELLEFGRELAKNWSTFKVY